MRRASRNSSFAELKSTEEEEKHNGLSKGDNIELNDEDKVSAGIEAQTLLKSFATSPLCPERNDTFVLYKFEDLPQYLQDNQWIHTGYRANYTIKLCFKSLFKVHNDLLGFITFVILTFVTLGVLLPEESTPTDKFIFSVFLICAQAQMLFSTVFHTFSCKSPAFYKWFAKLDYTGISVMIVGSYYPPLYYGFACWQPWRITYMTLITLFGVVGVCVSCIPVFSTPRYRTVRAAFFLVFGFFAVFPVPHLLYLNGWQQMWRLLLLESLMGALYTIGALIYSSRIPERFYPGKLDMTISSHVIWHFFTIAAALVQLYACLQCFYQRLAMPCSNL